MTKRITLRVALVVLVLLFILVQAGQAYPAHSFDAIAQPHRFALARWEVRHFIDSLFQAPYSGHLSPSPGQAELVRSYFQEGHHLWELQFRLELEELSDEERHTIERELRALEKQQAQKESQVRALLGAQVIEALRERGLDTSLLGGNIRLLFPPVRFQLQPLPQLLIVSPRDRIITEFSTLLEPDLSPAEIGAIEAGVEKMGYSGLVEHLGGVATYPSLLPNTVSLEHALSTIAHEWTHQFLYLHPLGRHYRAGYEMTIINETVADIVGNEIGTALLPLYQSEAEQPVQGGNRAAFDFNEAMRETRLTVDKLLAEGKIEAAEQYMEERRLFINAHGYYIRKLNQAYFAFHGSYGEGPAASSPIGGQLRALRQQSDSLGSFVREVAAISSYEEFQAILPE